MVPDTRTSRQASKRQTWVILCALYWLICGFVHADSFDDRRVRTGAKIFRSLLAADIALEQRGAAHVGKPAVLVWVIGDSTKLNAEITAVIAPVGDPVRSKIRNIEVQVQNFASLAATKTAPVPIAVYFSANLNEQDFAAWLNWGGSHKVLLFSPFEGHVERGMTAGLSVQAKVQPYLNSKALAAIAWQLKPFFLRVSRVYP
jgi:hypothetical protein